MTNILEQYTTFFFFKEFHYTDNYVFQYNVWMILMWEYSSFI